MNEQIYELQLRHIMKQAGADFLRYQMRLKWQMVAWEQGGTL